MTVRSSINIHFSPGDVVHKHTRSYSTLDFGDHATDTKACLFFEDAAAVDTVIAELTALRAEMTGENDGTWRLTPKGEAAIGEGGVLFPAGCDPDAQAESSYDLAIRQAEFFAQPGNTIDDVLAAQREAS